MNKSKKKGTEAEVAVVVYLHEAGFIYAERLALAGSNDRGDITGIPGVVIEVKNHKEMDLGGWIKETEAEMANANAEIGVVWHKRRGKANPGEWYVTMTGETFMRLLDDYKGP